jgi:hypothetical protein
VITLERVIQNLTGYAKFLMANIQVVLEYFSNNENFYFFTFNISL